MFKFAETVFQACSSFTTKKVMRIRSQLSIAVLILSTISLKAQDQTKIPAGISNAFKAGNASDMSRFINSTVELLLLDKEDFYKRNVAETILKDFFTEYKPKDFVISHEGHQNEAHYAIGILKTEKGDFRVYFLLKKVDQELLIHKIRIEPDNGK